MRLLLVEDEINLNRTLSSLLKSEHYIVDSCSDGKSALEYTSEVEYDAIILDIMLPKMNGFEVLSFLRGNNNKTPVLCLTALDSVENIIAGLDRGADDYLVKPFSNKELLARIRAIIRRKYHQASDKFDLAGLIIERSSRKVTRNGNLITLTNKEYSVLDFLAKNKGIVLTRDSIFQHLWGYDYFCESNVIDVYIRYLRHKIDEEYNPKLIHTVRGVGYVLDEV